MQDTSRTESLATRWHALLVAAAPSVADIRDRRRAELTATILLTCTPLVLGSMLVQLRFVPQFARAFPAFASAIALLVLAYVLSRTRYHRLGTALTALTPVAAGTFVGVVAPDDPAWFAYVALSPVVASALLPQRHAIAISILTVACAALGAGLAPTAVRSVQFVPALVFNVVLALLVVVSARHRDDVEAAREAALLAREKELAEARRMEAIGRLAGGIAHDFNNALTVVLANTELMERGVTREAAPRELRAAAEHARGLVQRLLTYSRQQELAPESLDLNARLRALLPMLQRLAGDDRVVQLELADDLWTPWVDATGLEQIAVNLVANARDATQAGGTIVLSTRNTSSAGPRNGDPRGDTRAYVVLAVRDSGTGMDGQTAARALEPFFTTKPFGKGTGLGLALVDGTTRQSGGFVALETSPGVGTVVSVHLPRANGPGPSGSA